jgi:hypothetical protein
VTVIHAWNNPSITSTPTVSTAGLLGFTGLALFRATFTRARFGLALAKHFLGVGLATARF